MESDNQPPMSRWSAPQCTYAVEYSPRTLDDIRLAVVDAFFSLPRGGVEIGGILLGGFHDGTLRIEDYRPMECEHSTGPSFTLSENDRARLAALLADAASGPTGRRPVGWYHSHTRSEILLSEADREIHLRFFPEPWQTALVLRPHTFQPARAGFFFREADGSLRGEGPAGEFVLAALAVKAAPRADAAAGPERGPVPAPKMQSGAPAINVTPLAAATVAEDRPGPHAAIAPARPARPASTFEPPREAQQVAIPKFLEEPAKGSHRAVMTLAIVGGILAAGGVAFQTRSLWEPGLAALYRRSAPPPAPLFLGLNAIDLAGQLQIRWDRTSPAVRQASEGMLQILDGGVPQANALDLAHLQAGVFTYARQTERVDVTLSASLPDGRQVREATSFLGTPPGLGTSESPEMRKTREDFAREAAKMKSDMNAQSQRTKNIEKSLAEVQKQLKAEQARRMLNQDAGK